MTNMKINKTAKVEEYNKRYKSNKELTKLEERDNYIRKKLIKYIGYDVSNMEVNSECGKMTYTLAVIIETNKRIYEEQVIVYP